MRTTPQWKTPSSSYINGLATHAIGACACCHANRSLPSSPRRISLRWPAPSRNKDANKKLQMGKGMLEGIFFQCMLRGFASPESHRSPFPCKCAVRPPKKFYDFWKQYSSALRAGFVASAHIPQYCETGGCEPLAFAPPPRCPWMREVTSSRSQKTSPVRSGHIGRPLFPKLLRYNVVASKHVAARSYTALVRVTAKPKIQTSSKEFYLGERAE